MLEGFIKHPAGKEDATLLASLLLVTLQGGTQVARPLATAVVAFAAVYAQAARTPVVLGAVELATTVAETVALLKARLPIVFSRGDRTGTAP